MNYIGDLPLNLIGKVAIVTFASSDQGAAICRELLNSNANVLGVDSAPAHKSTETSRASHFQFFQYDPKEPLTGKDPLNHAAKMYMKDDVDYFIDVVGTDAAYTTDLRKEVLAVFKEKGSGLILTVAPVSDFGVDAEQELLRIALSTTRELLKELKAGGVRWNLIILSGEASSAKAASVLDSETEAAMKKHMQAHATRRETSGYAVEPERDVANLVLFFCTKAGGSVEKALVKGNGSCISF
ncbi:hypothetical protein BKA65DRAFT_556408 [Rhexocercosporidium sp. MPI-PUGE-AT-0058]|nr:hypothetical protein BKA65DRAFT_556408 [Rhexocercosporidium sp. MPI-PUGE-AT-0058]